MSATQLEIEYEGSNMIVLHLLILYLAVGVPVWGYYSYKKFKIDILSHPGKRMTYYRRTVIELWTMAAVFAGYVYGSGISWSKLGFGGADWGWLSILFFAELVIFIVAPLIMVAFVRGYRETMDRQFQSIGDFLPGTTREKRFWIVISLTAGVCEELLFRSFLFYYLPLLLPGLSGVWVIVISSLIFGLGHCYQGIKGILSTAVLGGLFGCLYYFTGSVMLCMLLHFLIDARILALLPRDKSVGLTL
ncbi:CPBP family intramembrane glutamic endopeptidase [Paenibacillus wynnii]|uniref:CPBP family intramembrane glutamic endopeptidase n=1 Tax=Paenibacillus wynnii TaxID=268407 RepID=UPI0027D7A8A8|nr:CPBP family intramembrane glutamic endopeptidase [Paenibacillus wynnii]